MPGTSNEELLQKAAITAADALASGDGKLNPEQSERFLQFVFDETMLNQMSRTIKFRNEQLEINKINLGKRAAMPASEAKDPGSRRGVSHTKVVLQPVEVMVPVEISTTYKEHNIEGEKVVDTVLGMFGRQLANDWEELSIHGDTGGLLVEEDFLIDEGSSTKVREDTYLKLYDGWLQLADGSNLVDIAGKSLSGTVFRKMLNAMPSKFKRDKKRLRWICSHETEELWRERMSTRATAAGDAAMSSQGELTPFGIKMVPVPLLEHYPKNVQVSPFTGAGTTIQLGHAPVQAGSVQIILESAVGIVAIDSFEEGTDFDVDEANGTITQIASGAIPTTGDLRISYRALPQMLLTHMDNLITAIGRDITVEKDRDIYRRMDQYAIHVKFDAQIEELTAVVKAFNISDAL